MVGAPPPHQLFSAKTKGRYWLVSGCAGGGVGTPDIVVVVVASTSLMALLGKKQLLPVLLRGPPPRSMIELATA
jgi:hypothetical protein